MSIAWSCVARDGIILAEAGADDGKGKVIWTAQKISSMKPTCGWEKTTLSLKNAPYRGIKFHLHDATDADDVHTNTHPNSGKMIIWTFCCVYNSKKISVDCVKAFLTKIVYVTEPLRGMPWWREGTVLSAQPSFAPTLEQQMESANQAGKLSIMNQHVEETKSIMASNIEQILERGERMEDLQAESKELNQMSRVFKKKAKQLKRFKMWQNAKHGVMVGTAVTGAVGVVIIPPLIALL
mmetsp:Transcript_14252/g.30938  ORF Transcript_14252/g.30938 Transcript_14252/m.30938 type:complete len:238 (-) Transcript_14252:220-933(-)|eukprot:CAMPEP_0172315404 /NCGR_PEP_ID=MMETSP1058-20130122/25093_1 /TAXON_ID=83371 /ORGANISM="Detonula confervacea, Strain CCMP 353" /LENGTH=237 /DNA_ID=CAMNT_0013029477 /DNA_START=63 /DNA_END=776 /DNA_ORIENTATION=+